MTLTDFDRNNVDTILHDRTKDWFTAKLLRLIAQSDSHHRALLGEGFPEEVRLVEEHLGRERTGR